MPMIRKEAGVRGESSTMGRGKGGEWSSNAKRGGEIVEEKSMILGEKRVRGEREGGWGTQVELEAGA